MSIVSEALVSHRPEVFIILRTSPQACYAKAHIDAAPDGVPRTFVMAHASRERVLAEVTGWALDWLRRLRESKKHEGPNRR